MTKMMKRWVNKMKNRIDYLIKQKPFKVLGVGASVVVLLTILIVLVINVGNSYMKSNTGIPNQVVEGLSFENASIEVENGISKYRAEVKNNLNESMTLKTIEVVLKDEKGEEITRLIGYIGNKIEPEESKILEASIDEEINTKLQVEYLIHK